MKSGTQDRIVGPIKTVIKTIVFQAKDIIYVQFYYTFIITLLEDIIISVLIIKSKRVC